MEQLCYPHGGRNPGSKLTRMNCEQKRLHIEAVELKLGTIQLELTNFSLSTSYHHFSFPQIFADFAFAKT